MVSDWSVRDEVLRVTHNWPIPVLAFLIGSMIGWGLSFLAPVSYQAEAILTVAYDDARQCRNPDDCKNWQLEQTDTFARSQVVLQPTLIQLRTIDSFWQEISIEELSEMLDVLWRNAGQWRFVATSNNKEISKSAAEIWTQVLIDEYQAAQEHSLKLVELNAQMQALNQSKIRLDQDLLILGMVKDELEDYRNALEKVDQGGQLDELHRWELFNFAAQAAGNSPAWNELLETFPVDMAAVSDYTAWIDKLLISIDQEIESLQLQLEQIEHESDKLLGQIEAGAEKSQGLTQTIRISKTGDGEPKLIESRKSTSAAVIGGFVGLLVWGMVWIAFPIWRSEK